MKKIKYITTSILIILLIFTLVFAYANTYKQNRSGGYSSVCTLTKEDKNWIINNFSHYNTVEDLIIAVNDYICKNFKYVDKTYIQHFDFAETVENKTGLCFDFASLQKCIVTVIAEYKDWDIKVYVADVETRTDAHSYTFITVNDKKYFSDPTSNLTRYTKGKQVIYYEDISNLSFEEYASLYNEKIYNYH